MIDLKYICTVIGDLAGMPIRIYEEKNLTFYYSVINLPKDPLCLWLDGILAGDDHVGYFITPIFNYYGIVRSGKTTVVIGPTRQAPANEQDLRELAFQLDVPAVDTDDFVLAMKNIVQMPLDSILQMLFSINHILNGEKLSLKDIKIIDAEQEKLKLTLEAQTFGKAGAAPVPDNHSAGTYELEQTLMNIVRHGDTTTLKQWISNAPSVTPGVIADEHLRQASLPPYVYGQYRPYLLRSAAPPTEGINCTFLSVWLIFSCSFHAPPLSFLPSSFPSESDPPT